MTHVVTIGSSWGGMRALQTILGALEAGFSAPIVVAQHRDGHVDVGLLPELLGRRTPLLVTEGED